jgi:uncharacterized membrane protein YfcA
MSRSAAPTHPISPPDFCGPERACPVRIFVPDGTTALAAHKVRRQGSPAIQAFTVPVIIYSCVVMAAAYSARGASGFGAAVALPLLGLVLPLKLLIPAWTLIAAVGGTTILGSDRDKVLWWEIAKLIPGTLIGVGLGLAGFTRLSSDTLAIWIGCFVLAYGAYSLWTTFGAAKPHLPPRAAALVGGIFGGATGTIVGTFGSTFYAIYFDAIKLGKDHYRATMTAILLTLSLARGTGYFAFGEFTRDVLIVAAMLMPPMFVGIFIGNRLHHGMSEKAFRRTVACALIVSGFALLIK